MGDESKKLSFEEIKSLAQQEGQEDIPEELVEKIAQKLTEMEERREQEERRKEELTQRIKMLLPNFVGFKKDYKVADLERLVGYLENMQFDYAKRVVNKELKRHSFRKFLFMFTGTLMIGIVLFFAKMSF